MFVNPVWPVAHSALLRKPEFLRTRDELAATIDLLIENLINIRDETGEFLLRLDDGREIDTKGWSGWEWTHGVGLYGIWQYYSQTGDARARTVVDEWFRDRFTEAPPTKNVNTMAPMLTLASLYADTHDRTLRPRLESWGEWAFRTMPRTPSGGMQHVTLSEENPDQMWDDTLVMTVLPLLQIGKLLGRQDYVDEAIYQFLIHTANLRDPRTGLWFHGWHDSERSHFAGALWARGNSWITIGLPDFLESLDLPSTDPTFRYFRRVLEEQIEALAACQDRETGLWHTLLDQADTYLEASATAGFAYGILKAIRKGYVTADYTPVANRAVSGILDNISDDGELRQVSFGTAMGHDMEHYKNIPLTSMPYGQAMAILALSEYLRTYN